MDAVVAGNLFKRSPIAVVLLEHPGNVRPARQINHGLPQLPLAC